MARYYKYKSMADVVADAEQLGGQIALTDDFSPLFQPVNVGNRTAGNRLAVQPMEGCDGKLDGSPDELTYRRYQRFGAGGAKIIWGEATAIADEARMNPRQLWLNEHTQPAIAKMLADCRQAHRESCGDDGDLLIGLQLTHSGRYSCRKPLIATHDPLLDPLTIDKSVGKPVASDYPLLTDDDLKRIEDQYLEATRLAVQCGVDFVDIKQCHRYLLSELLSATERDGEYGGSLENRTRLVRNIVTRIRSEFPQLLIASRINVYDGIPYRGQGDDFIGAPVPHELPIMQAFGTAADDHTREQLEEPLQVIRWLCDWGVSLLNVSAGNPYANPHLVRPAEFPPVDGYRPPEHPLLGVLRHFRLTAAVQQVAGDVPVIGSGYSWLQDFALHAGAANVQAGHAAIVGMGRATLSHPDFAKAVQTDGHMDRKRICRTFSYCTNLMRTKTHPLGQYPTGCPPFDKEIYGPIWQEISEANKQ